MSEKAQMTKKKFPPLFWLVVLFEFFERGAYYGMMSFISVYFVNVLDFPKESVGVIKGVIQPLLYFLPIISGALADRFGYRKLLMIAFSLLGGGYFLTSQSTSYGGVFAALVIMGFGAGFFKPLISGVIAKVTDESNSTLGFGIFYWTINLGAFIFPLVLVPYLKKMDPTYVIIASAICTAVMLIPTALFFRDPVKRKKAEDRKKLNLIQTLANAFEIIYSPIVLIYYQMKKSLGRRFTYGLVLIALIVYALMKYLTPAPATERFSKIGISQDGNPLIVQVDRYMLGKTNYQFSADEQDSSRFTLTIFKPSLVENFADSVLVDMQTFQGFENVTAETIHEWVALSDKKVSLAFKKGDGGDGNFAVQRIQDNEFCVILFNKDDFASYQDELLDALHEFPVLAGISKADCSDLFKASKGRSFFPLFVFSLLAIGLGIITISIKKEKSTEGKSRSLGFVPVLLIGACIWLLPGLDLLGRIIASVVYITIMSLFKIDKSEPAKFSDHAKFLLMIFLYSGFWVMYFQMFDSVLWYVQAYVDATSVNIAINNFLGIFGIQANWFFDVEHVTVLNAGTIILLQIFISMIVRKTKALPTMMVGIALGSIGMGILAINTGIWVFLAGIAIFSVGEMTAHPKFISYIGLIAPEDRKASYMGYLFLYGVFGSSIGGIVGAKLYVHFVDYLNQPRTLWLIFSGIGVFTIVALALYNKFLNPHSAKNA